MTGFYLRFDSLEEYAALDNEQFGRLIRAGLRFAINGTEPDLSEPESYLWPGLRLRIIHNAELYQRKCEQNAANIRKRWERQRQEQERNSTVYDGIQTNTKDTNININSKDKDKGKDKDSNNASAEAKPQKKTTKFIPPTVEEVRQFCQENGYITDPEQFVDYYQARGWYLKPGQQMKDWKASVRYWERNRKGGGNNGGYTGNQTEHGAAHRPDYSFLRDGSNSV